ncbi:MAG: L-2-hydroxyglutarate oxidase [bacterium]
MYDIAIIGGGIVGVATAWQLTRKFPGKKILLLEKERALALHQTGRNSGVIHSGIYYEPKSKKAQFCRRGLHQTVRFCEEYGIPFDQCGKLLVASTADEMSRMTALYQRSIENGVAVEKLDQHRLRELEPNIIGLGALKVPDTGIVNFGQIAEKMAALFRQADGEICFGAKVKALSETNAEISISAEKQTFRARYLIACGGLQADRIAAMMGVGHQFQIIPYRGEYYRLAEKHNDLIEHLIYPIPDPALPFLGIHLTRMIGGFVTVGPNALQGWNREGYGRGFSFRDSAKMLRFPGFWKVAGKHWKAGLSEIAGALSKTRYLQQVQKYCPQIALEDLKSHPVGIRAQAVMQDGTLVHDFLFAETLRSLHVCNAPSPAATSAIPIAEYLCQKVEMRKLFS